MFQDSDGQLSNLYDPDVSLAVNKASINSETLRVQTNENGSLTLRLKFKGEWKE